MEAARSSFPSSLFVRAEDWFLRAKANLLGSIPCSRGCCACCIGPFPITVLDVEHLQQGLEALPEEHREKIKERARRQIHAIQVSYPRLATEPVLDHCPDSEIDRVVTQLADMPCPALESDGTCAVYQFRPVTCRTMGIPTEAAGTVHGACERQTFIPIVRLAQSLRGEENNLAEQEAHLLKQARSRRLFNGDEVLSPYGFLVESNRAN